MRALHLFPIALALALVVVSSPATPAGAIRSNPHCTIPLGWRLVAKDRQAVVIAQKHKHYPPYDYCNRAVARWVRFATPEKCPGCQNPIGSLVDLKLAGRYVAWEAAAQNPCCPPIPIPNTSDLNLVNTRTGTKVPGENVFSVGARVGPLLLSPNGVAARISLGYSRDSGSSYGVAILPAPDFQTTTTFVARQQTDIANLQLYDCSVGCTPRTTIVTWTQGGVQQYAEVTGL
jgi:hypothetical protein